MKDEGRDWYGRGRMARIEGTSEDMSAKRKRDYFTNLFYLLVGLLFGIIGNMWVYFCSKWLEVNFPDMDWNLSFLLISLVYFLFGLALFVYIARGLRKPTRKKLNKV
jgi:ABC-type antimicrobial peptide transport system permease subunit